MGSKIVRFGGLSDPYLGKPHSVESGGLVVDYIPEGASEPRRVVFGFNELGMWREFTQVGE